MPKYKNQSLISLPPNKQGILEELIQKFKE